MKETRLLVVSVLVLLLELALIRYLGSEVPVLGFFKNLVLIAAFLGLGLGLNLKTPTKKTFFIFAAGFVLPHILLYLLLRSGLIRSAIYAGMDNDAVLLGPRSYMGGFAIICMFFVAVQIPMAALGRLLGMYFNDLGKPLRAYGVNIAGSLLGTILFSIVCTTSAPPEVWFAIGAFLFLILAILEHPNLGWTISILLSVVTFSVVPCRKITFQGQEEVWTPYYKVNLAPLSYSSGLKTGYQLNVNNTWFQRSFDVRLLGRPEETAEDAHAARNLRFVAPFVVRKADDVLILGSGLGTDTAAALRFGAQSVDAVDIDPVIIRLSDSFHPNQPYRDPRVRVVVDDARHFLSSMNIRYDLILMGVLEARSLFSQFGNLRLDNYVYTREALVEAKKHLKPGGILWLNMWIPKPWISDKLVALMENVFGRNFMVLRGSGSDHWSFVGGDSSVIHSSDALLASIGGIQRVDSPAIHRDQFVTMPVDDWPYIFYRSRQLPWSYLALLGSMLLLSVVPLRLIHRDLFRIHWIYFFLGAAFLLVETSAVVRMALVAGTTWFVNSAVFTGILLSILLSNVVVAKRPVRKLNLVFIALFGSLFLVYFFPFHVLLALPNLASVPVASVILSLPVFFSGIIFSSLIHHESVPSSALASNLFGAILGGLSEYLSMLTGNRFMSLLALCLYLLAFLFLLRRQKASV